MIYHDSSVVSKGSKAYLQGYRRCERISQINCSDSYYCVIYAFIRCSKQHPLHTYFQYIRNGAFTCLFYSFSFYFNNVLSYKNKNRCIYAQYPHADLGIHYSVLFRLGCRSSAFHYGNADIVIFFRL